MSTEVTKRPAHRPPSINPGIANRRKIWQIAERCAQFTPEYEALLGKVLRGEPIQSFDVDGKLKYTEYPEIADRIDAGERLMNRAFGRPHQSVEVDQSAVTMTKVIHEVRWLPPDPNDRSVVTVPEPD
jgi:hypothetical protein